MAGIDLNSLAQFNIVARHLNFRRAADELLMSPSTLSDRIKALEAELGGRLLNRSTRSASLTELGARLLERTGDALAVLESEIEEARASAAKGQTRGRLRINGPLPAIDLRLMQLVPGFLEAHPAVQLEIFVQNELVDVIGAGFDAGIRYDEKLEQDMIALRLGPEQRMVIAATGSYLSAFGTPQTPEDLQAHQCITTVFLNGNRLPWSLSRDGRSIEFVPRGRLLVNSVEAGLAAVRASAGLIYTFEEYIAQDLRDGRLSTIMPDWTQPFPGPSLYYFQRRLMPPVLRAFVEHAKKHCW